MSVNQSLSTFQRALAYIAGGVTGEILYTGIKNPPTFQGYTQLWVMPLYAFGGIFAFEPLHERMRDQPVFLRVAAYAVMCFAIEYVGGWATEQFLGECPWKYTSQLSVHGYINLTFFPLWGLLGYCAEKVHDCMKSRLLPFK